MFHQFGYTIVDRIEDCDILCWTGGDDLNPKLYNERPAGAMAWDDQRDKDDLLAWEVGKDKFKVGICRGAQFLNVANGGTLWQDIDKHETGFHPVTDMITYEEIMLNSLHHQQMRPGGDAEVLAVAKLATVKQCYSQAWHCDNDDEDPDIEAVYYPETRSLCFQPHPEFDILGSTGQYFNRLLERFWLAT